MQKSARFSKLALYALLAISMLATACGSKPKLEKKLELEDALLQLENYNYDTLKGIYVGQFSGSPISIVLTYVNENHAIGYDIHKGLKRNISGTHSVDGDYIVMLLNEPGDNKYDGKFKLKIDKKTFDVLGDWSPVSTTLKGKMFTLKKRITKESDSLINENNFSERFGFVSDTLGEMSFERDGSCTYTYVPVLDAEERREQAITVKGNWSLFNKTVNITWEQNTVFTSGESEFIIREEEYSYSLVGEHRVLFVTMY